MSPRHVPASVTELSRIGLLAGLPGEVLNELAREMTRTLLAGGEKLELGDGFAAVLSGMASSRGAMLRPGTHIGPGGAVTIAAVTTASVASCDRATYDRLVAPHIG